MHRIWLKHEDFELGLQSLCQWLGIEAAGNTKNMISLVYSNLFNRNPDVKTLFIIHDCFYTDEIGNLAQSICEEQLNVNFLIVGNSKSPNPPPLSTKLVRSLEPLDPFACTAMLKENLKFLKLDPENDSETLAQISTLAFGLPRLICTLCELIKSSQSTSNPMGLNSTVALLKTDMSNLLRFNKVGCDISIYEKWQSSKRKLVPLDEASYDILRLIAIGFDGTSPTGDVSTVWKLIHAEAPSFEDDLVENNLCSIEVDEYKAHTTEIIKIYPLINELVKAEILIERKTSFLTELFRLCAPEHLKSCSVLPKVLQRIWEFVAWEDALRLPVVKEFRDFTVSLGGNWETIPLDDGSYSYSSRSRAQSKFKQLLTEAQREFDDSDKYYCTLKAYEAVYNVRNDHKNCIPGLIDARQLQISRKELVSDNIPRFMLQQSCCSVSNIILQEKIITREYGKLIRDWILQELKERDELEIDYVLFSFLTILGPEQYQFLIDFGDALIREWFRADAWHPEGLICDIIFLSGTIVRVLSNEIKIPGLREVLLKLRAIIDLDPPLVFKGVSVWKFFLFDSWPGWFARSLWVKNNDDFLAQFLITMISVSGTLEQ